MRNFCISGINQNKNWKDINEVLKDFIYYYFNSKYAKPDFVFKKDYNKIFVLFYIILYLWVKYG